jgi:type IV pilus assembly protein PilY1
MFYLRKSTLLALALMLGTFMVPTGVRADDIDIFLGSSAGSADAPNIIFLIDNTTNWTQQAQHWPDSNNNQGQAELTAISSVLNKINSTRPANVGLAMLSGYAGSAANGATPGTGGGYIRFGVRDMTNATNRTVLQNILTGIAANTNTPAEKINEQVKDEEAAFYEIYKYLSGLAPFTGLANQNPLADVAGNTGNTGAGQGLTSGFAITGGLYQSPLSSGKPCASTYIIYVANNSSSQPKTLGQAAYEPAVANANPALSAQVGYTDTWLDEWTSFLRTNGVVVPTGNNNGSVVTYVLDAYNALPNPDYSNSLKQAALRGGGKYYQVGSQTDIANALGMIFSEIQAVNSTFASASLPVSTTNRTQNKNQVFIPMFRPDPADRPLWMGNLKQYQLINLLGSIDLGDNSNPPIDAVNHLTGFVTPCAQSFWTTDSGTYWKSNVFDSPTPKGICPFAVTGFSPWSDAPDGPLVEKGGVAEVIRKGNNPPATNTTPTWAVNRKVYTLSGLTGTALTSFTSTSLGISAANVSLANFILGQDINDENVNHNTTEVRPSVHGDVIHSRPQAVDYGGTTGVTVYYGSNDGTLRAIDSGSGAERWAFIAPEFYTPDPTLPPATTPTGFSRLMNDNPLISYPSIQSGLTPTPVPKDYYFDGSIGLYQAANNSSVWIYPSMRRGGRTIYAFDVTNPASPQFKWKAGCPYPQGNNTGCTVGMSGIGQTWSAPAVAASVVGYSGPVVIVGGGYDTCEDANTATPSCASPNGAGVYVLDANTGAVIRSFSTIRSVAADVALIAMATAGVVDHAWAVDTGGNIYRLDFVGPSSTNWVMNKVAYTTGAGRKFLLAPALAAVSGHVYVALGSGDREHPLQSQYPYSAVVNRFYVYVDDLATTSATNLDDTTVMDDFTLGASGQLGTTTSCSTQGVLPSSSMKGWFINLNQYGQGEQTVTSPIIAAGAVAFSTNRPIPAAQGTCSTSLGQALGYWVDLFNASGAIGVPGATCGGARASIFTGGGLPPSPVLANVVVAGQSMTVAIGAANLAGPPGGISVTSSGVITPQSDPNSCTGCTQQIKPAIVPARKKIYWKSSGEN